MHCQPAARTSRQPSESTLIAGLEATFGSERTAAEHRSKKNGD
jgi:hypothetical protein